LTKGKLSVFLNPINFITAKDKFMGNTLLNQIFHDDQGNIVIAQPPNLPLIVGIVASLLRLILTTGRVNIALDLIAFGSLFTWAWQELFQGVNYFRRALVLVVLTALMAGKLL